ncbi:MAG TPA: sensor domain-containing diguanylate cyclase [Gemmatimonadaceae bacterium]|nr:sensor domain-containing diguanylate cyclase [Gemmatimonadaceae bacterium]
MIRPLDARLLSPSRLTALRATGLLDGNGSVVLDRLARLVTRLLDVPVAAVSLVDAEGQHFPGMHGLEGWAAENRGTPMAYSFCQHVVTAQLPLVVEDASAHPLVRENPGHTEFGVVAYAGVPLRNAQGETLGALCAIDMKPVQWTAEQLAVLEDLAAGAMAEIELRATARALVEAQDKLVSLVTHDDATGLLNRRGFNEQAARHVAFAERLESPFLILALDLDEFKVINDTLGYDAGDRALLETGTLLSGICGAADVVARVGGDEFMLLLANCGVDEMHRARERVHAAIARRNQHVGASYQLASSIGIAVWTPRNRKPLVTLQRLADEAMHADKRARRERLLQGAGLIR